MRTVLAVFCALVVGVAGAARAGEAAPAASGKPILDKGSYWRCFMTWKTLALRQESGELEHGEVGGSRNVKYTQKKPVRSALPPAGWTLPEFDDGSWGRCRGHLAGLHRTVALICLRGKFEVPDPARAKDLTLSLAVRGGAAVYLNGKELTRAGMPQGKIDSETPASDYPEEAYLDPEGYLYRNEWGDPKKYSDRLRARVRDIKGFKVPAKMLRKGVNVLAVQIHRAPASHLLLLKKAKPRRWRQEMWRGASYYWWTTIGFEGASLTAPAGARGVVPNVARPKGLQVWNHPIPQRVYVTDYGDPNEPLRPVKLVGPRGAVLSGQVVVGRDGPITGLSVAVGELAPKRKESGIPASAVRVLFPRPDGPRPRGRPACFGSLAAEPPPAEVAPAKGADGAVQPVWVRVRVPRDAEPGEYSGRLTVKAKGARSVEVPLELEVCGWTMPEPRKLTSHMDLVQSPDSLAMQYGVEMWSEKHWKLIDRSFRMLGEVGTKGVYIPLIRRTHFGNEHGMVRWIRKDGGGWAHDYGIAEKYLETAMKHLGKPRVVCLYAWEICTGGKYFGHKSKGIGKGMQFTVLDPATKTLEEAEGPKWGDPKVREFWKPVMDGMRERLRKRGLEKSMMLGVSGDTRPVPQAVADLKAVAPQALWVSSSHGYCTDISGQGVGFMTYVWGTRPPADPSAKRLYGWKNPVLVTTFPRAGSGTVGAIRPASPLAMYFVAFEAAQAAGIHGYGRMGADFWPVLKDKRGRRRDILGRYPESGWAQLNMRNSFPYILAPGREGAEPTVRFEMFRAGLQQAEARIFIEKALTDAAQRAKLGEELAARCQKLLDARVWTVLYARRSWSWFPCSGWQAKNRRLYRAAAEVAKALGAK